MFNKNSNDNNNITIYIERLLIESNNIKNALNIFNSISNNKKNVYLIFSIKCSINNNKRAKAIALIVLET